MVRPAAFFKTQCRVSILTTCAIAIATLGVEFGINDQQVLAANLALSLGDLVTPPSNTTISGLCSSLKQCQPGDIITVSVPEGTSSRYVQNDTNFNLSQITYTILPGQEVVWNPASKFSFFQKREISVDGKILTFSDGAFFSGTTGLFTRTGNVPVKITVSIEGQPKSIAVIEPSIILGLLAVSSFSLLLRNKGLQKI
ncbi:MAG TPA: hypothetical protein VE944_16540 [Nostoc sp.]|uniref:hypothetical protein n=1 Tax=Nostoc sp. TaxID=1180 RepID=UPI002D3B53BA|nr:hypothetical protein [Nostoc sp.]HYX15940.1 hypothetical protein [Nostoc sp.]